MTNKEKDQEIKRLGENYRRAEEDVIRLTKELNEKNKEIADNNDFMAMMYEFLDEQQCMHEDNTHKNTPPMFWPELIRCIWQRKNQDLIEKYNKLKEELVLLKR